MTGTAPEEEATLFPKTAGERLREIRESQGMSLAEVAARTRVPMRHLEAIEQSNFASLPSPTYSVGFAKAYARAVGADEIAIGREVRTSSDATSRLATPYQPYEMNDPTRVPPRGLAMAGAILALIVLVGAGLWYGTGLFRGEGSPPPVTAPASEIAAAPVAEPAPPPVPTGGQVTLTATDLVWLKVYDASGKTLFQGELKPGDHYDVPGDADRPMINVGRPDQLQVTVNGSSVAPLGDGKRAIKDVGISAAALLARGQAPVADAAAPATGDDVPAAFKARDGADRADKSRRPRSSGSSNDRAVTAGANAAPATTPSGPSTPPPTPAPAPTTAATPAP